MVFLRNGERVLLTCATTEYEPSPSEASLGVSARRPEALAARAKRERYLALQALNRARHWRRHQTPEE
jgi:hypothetical protein